MNIDPQDLVPAPMPIKIGGYFYLKSGQGYELCCITSEDVEGPRVDDLRRQTAIYHDEGRLFVRRDKHWSKFL